MPEKGKLQPVPNTEEPPTIPECIHLSDKTRRTLREILTRRGYEQAVPEDTVAQAIEVYNVLTSHLSRKDTKVILHTLGAGLETLHINPAAGNRSEEIRSVV